MKPLAFNLRGAKKIAGGKDSSTFQLENGHRIMVAHAPLPALQRKQLEKMPVHLDEGGAPEIEEGDESSPANNDVAPAPVEESSRAYPVEQAAPPAKAPTSVQELIDANNAAVAKDSPAPAKVPNSNVTAPIVPEKSSGFDVNAAYNQGQQAITEAANVAKQNAVANAATYQNDLDARKQLNDNFKNNLADFQAHQKQLLNDYAAGHIDPNHYQENMSTGSKVSTAIGLLLGGIASARNGGTNPAAQYLNDQINRDIASQKENIDKKKTLLGANQELYKDSVVAEQATRINMNDMLDHQIQMQAAKTGSAQAKAAADAAHSTFALQNAQLLQSMATKKAVANQIGSGGAGLNPLMLGNAGYMKPEEAQKEQSALNSLKSNIEVGKQAFARLNQLQTVGQAAGSPLQTQSLINGEKAKLRSIIQAANPSERLNDAALDNEIDPYLPKFTDNAQTRQEKLMGFEQHVALKFSPQFPVTSQYAPGAIPNFNPPKVDPSVYIQWAQKNPKDPRAQVILQKYGAK